MQKRRFNQGLSSFFECAPHGLIRDERPFQLNETFGEQAQAPARLAGGRGSAGEGDQPRFLAPVQGALVLARRRFALWRSVQPSCAERPPDAADGGLAHVERAGNLGIGPANPCRGSVGFQQNARVGERAGCRCAGPEHAAQRPPFLVRQMDRRFVTGSRRVGGEDAQQFHAADPRTTRQIMRGAALGFNPRHPWHAVNALVVAEDGGEPQPLHQHGVVAVGKGKGACAT